MFVDSLRSNTQIRNAGLSSVAEPVTTVAIAWQWLVCFILPITRRRYFICDFARATFNCDAQISWIEKITTRLDADNAPQLKTFRINECLSSRKPRLMNALLVQDCQTFDRGMGCGYWVLKWIRCWYGKRYYLLPVFVTWQNCLEMQWSESQPDFQFERPTGFLSENTSYTND